MEREDGGDQVDWAAIERARLEVDALIQAYSARGARGVTLARVVAVRRDNPESVQHHMPSVGPDPLALLTPMAVKLVAAMAENGGLPVLERASLQIEAHRARGGRTTLHLDQAPGAGRLKVSMVLERLLEPPE